MAIRARRTSCGAFMSPDASAGLPDGDGRTRTCPSSTSADTEPTAWLPTDRPSAVARAGVRQAVVVRIAPDDVVTEPIVVDLRGDAPLSLRARRRAHRPARAGDRGARARRVRRRQRLDRHRGRRRRRADDAVRHGRSRRADPPVAVAHAGRPRRQVRRGGHHDRRAHRAHRAVGVVLRTRRISRAAGCLPRRGRPVPRAPDLRRARPAPLHEQRRVYKGALTGAGSHTVWIGDVLVRRTATGTTRTR